MKQSTSGLHVAIIMDGNGRWATSRKLPRAAGHRAGADALRRTVEAAPSMGVSTLTVYAFSSDNWKRPPAEVTVLMGLFEAYLKREKARCIENDVRVSLIGRRDRLPRPLLPLIESIELATGHCRRLHLRLAVDYSSRDALVAAALKLEQKASRETISGILGPDVDLLIRTASEKRLSDFLLWECAYAEFIFSPKLWPDFGPADLAAAITEFRSRERRFGAIVA
jgi:undecaprenyl diphosphate synthase